MASPFKTRESEMEAESRKAANFPEVEKSLFEKYSDGDMSLVDKFTSFLGTNNPFGKKATPEENEVWLLDNTAYRPTKSGKLEPWQAEFVCAYFIKGRKDLNKDVSKLLDTLGLDGELGKDPAVTKTIEERLKPFVHAISPAHSIELNIDRKLGPSDPNGISSQVLLTGGGDDANGKTVQCTSIEGYPPTTNTMTFVAPEGWLICSDIDDTIKRTMTPDPLGVLKSTFVDEPEVIKGMPELYRTIDEHFSPAWFYLSASPYNLYPFLRKFINANFKQGTIILRDKSWMFFAGLLQSLTEGVQEYKTDRLRKIHSWLPQRKVICIGDSTQSDPESYAALYREFPGWIKAIYIRKVTDAPFMDQKNRDERFQKAFKDIPSSDWTVFEKPSELNNHLKHLTGEVH
ncbi:Phosphatidate phosphatase APP1 [Cyphellophora attinorum]|uniref:Phosphatidate phosphatase APP1 n=1 Tax=Cyphellophora attinorum TaxID=1664694 RepID=A0A0N1HAA9_9EURO|nr:Phosphatidate phosphatase APP1 [Phialophora attinorum]KPI44770.1 Phosphatidate phosphatase APP1 [Phialophora attinorum]